MSIVLQIIYLVLLFFLIALIARLVLDYIQMFARSWRPGGPLLVVAELIYTVTDPPLRIGQVSLDLSYLVLFVLVSIGMSLTR